MTGGPFDLLPLYNSTAPQSSPPPPHSRSLSLSLSFVVGSKAPPPPRLALLVPSLVPSLISSLGSCQLGLGRERSRRQEQEEGKIDQDQHVQQQGADPGGGLQAQHQGRLLAHHRRQGLLPFLFSSLFF